MMQMIQNLIYQKKRETISSLNLDSFDIDVMQEKFKIFMKEKKEYQQFPKYCQDKKKIRETLQKILCKIGFI